MRALLPLVAALVLSVLAPGPTSARPMNIPSGNPVVSVDVPGGWKSSATSRGIEVRSPDEEVFFWLEVYLPAQLEAIRAEHQAYFTKQGVKITGEPKVATINEGTVKVVATDLPATWNGKPTVLRYLAIDPSLPGQNQILLSYWASPEGDKTHEVAFKKVIGSLNAPK